MAVQTMADIDTISPSLTTQIVENAGNLFILKQRVTQSAQSLSQTIGTIMSKKRTLRFEDDETQNMGSEREVRELIVHPDIIKNLNIGQCVLLRQGPSKINILNLRKR
jgi:conjugal transfer pilus assembly protein TraD